jgi:hypothetical protein
LAASTGHLGGLGELLRLPNDPGLWAGRRFCWVFNPPNQVFAGRKPSIGPQLAVKRPTNSLFPQRHQVVVEVAAAATGDLVEWHQPLAEALVSVNRGRPPACSRQLRKIRR